MKHSKRFIKKQYKNLINKKALAYFVNNSNLCKHAIKELKLAGYGKGEGGPSDWMYKQVLEAIAVFSSHENSGFSAPCEINLVKKLCSFDIISPLTFKDDEWIQISYDGTCQNKRKRSIFKNPDGSINDVDAITNLITKEYYCNSKKFEDKESPSAWSGIIYETKNNILTGRYFRRCYINLDNINNGYIPKKPIYVKCTDVIYDKNESIFVVEFDSKDLIEVQESYNIDWKELEYLKGVSIENINKSLFEN